MTPNATLVASYKVSDRLAFTSSFSYDKERTLDNQFQDQNRNQWTITNSATPPYAGPLGGAGYSQLSQYNANGAETSTLDQRNKDIANNFQWVQLTAALTVSCRVNASVEVSPPA